MRPRPAGVFGRTRPAGGGGGQILPPLPAHPCLTLERLAVERRVRWQSKALDEYFLSNLKKIVEGRMSGQAKVRQKVKIVTFRLIGFSDGNNNSSATSNFAKRLPKG